MQSKDKAGCCALDSGWHAHACEGRRHSPLPLIQPLCRRPAALLHVWLCAPAAGHATLQGFVWWHRRSLELPSKQAWAFVHYTEQPVSLAAELHCSCFAGQGRLGAKAATNATTLPAGAVLHT